MKWRLAIGGDGGGKNKERGGDSGQNREAEARRNSGDNGGGNNSGNGGMNAYGGNHMPVQLPPAVSNYRQPQSNYPQMNAWRNGGGAAMGYYDNTGMSYDMGDGGRSTRAAQMGYIWDDPQDRRGGGREARNEEYYPMEELEARRRRSSRTGRFVRGESGGYEARAHGGWDDDDGDERGERGSYSSRRSGEEEHGGGLERLRKKMRMLEHRVEEGEEGREHIKHLKKKIRKLEEALEEMQDGEGRKGEKKKGKEKSGEKGEDDEEDDPSAVLKKLLGGEVKGKDFLRYLPRIFLDAVEVIKHPPDTWPPYLEKEEYAGIYDMESRELHKAIAQYRSGTGTLSDVMREVEHTVAAAVQLKAHLLQNDVKPSNK